MATPPSIEQVERAILNEIAALKVRAGQIFKPMTINIKLQGQGYTGAEITEALQVMADKGWVDTSTAPTSFLKLTAAGYAAI